MSRDTRLFRALEIYNFRVWAIGALVSNVGTWMQRVAQDWLVLTILTHHNAGAVGVAMALQFGPQLLLLPLTGYAADYFDRRKLIMLTQTMLGLLAFGLGVATVTGVITLWGVYGFALALGCVTAFDAPTRQTFVNDLVGETHLSNAVALNSTSFNSARMVGPAVAGLLIAAVGVGWVFLINAASFAAVLGSLCLLRVHELRPARRPARKLSGLTEGFRYVWRRPDLKTLLIMLFLIGTFGFNFPIFISTMAVTVFHGNAGQYGLLTSALAVGSVTGALLAAKREQPSMSLACIATFGFGLFCGLAAIAPDEWLFAAALMLIGLSALSFNTSTNALMQLSTDADMRGRVMALRIAIVRGGTPLGAPIVGWAADHAGPRWAMGIGCMSGVAAAGVCLVELLRERRQAAAPCRS
ncbi:MFS transporter [Salinisphaera hydrothermalis]|uniref:Major facilitator superfamily transporter n=1 Tax=Salinisphaera hydrothermalis (strain C41B8) TaxID=1304275 RepID=A0A084IJ35_SALHC|nr:MFS transporter [Salinisphaera hydrothermalis]KEZ76719.1 major facilitator superfamily transporter [Salinisphaera hydrothermalis C41B8]